MNNEKEGCIERQALIFNKQKYNTYDGPGIRTLVFFKGCPLRCKWCSNPESLETGYSVMFKQDLCMNCGECAKVCPVNIHKMVDGVHIVDRSINCNGCRNCEKACCNKALKIAGEKVKISELYSYVEEDRTFYDISGGGVTLGGGEVTAQAESARSLLMTCKRGGINTAIETCGYVKLENLLKIAEFTDTFLIDIKHMDPEMHMKYTGVRNERILDNIKELLERRYNVKVRMPMLKGINDYKEEIEAVIEFLSPYRNYKNFLGVDVLPYHKLGVYKYAQLGWDYELNEQEPLSEEDLVRIKSYFDAHDFEVNILRH